MPHLPIDLAPDPDATFVVETRVRRWRERARRQLEAGDAETRPCPDAGAGGGAREAAEAERDGERRDEVGEKRKHAFDDSLDDTEAARTSADADAVQTAAGDHEARP